MSLFDKYRPGYTGDDASQTEYTNLSGSDLLRDRGFIDDLRKYYDGKGQSFSNTSEMLDDWYTDNRWKDSNFLSAGLDMIEYSNAGSDQALMARLSKAWQNAPTRGTTFERVKDYGLATIADPINFVPYAGAASKASRVAKIARAGGATKAAAAKTAMKVGAKRGALLEGSVGATLGGSFEALQQSRQQQQGLSEGYDVGRIATAGALEGVFSSAIGAPLGALASKAPAQRALEWKVGTPLGDKMNSRLIELNDMERIAQSQAADDTLPTDVREDAKNELLDIEKERSDTQAAVNRAVQMDNELDNKATAIETAKADGRDTSALQAEFQTKYNEFQTLLSSTDIDQVTRLSNADINASRTAEAQRPTEEEVKKAKETAKKAKEANASGGTKADTDDATGDTDDTAAEAGDTTETEAGGTTDTTAEAGEGAGNNEAPAAEAEPIVPMDVPDTKAVKFKFTEGQKPGWVKGFGNKGATHANKVKKANEKNGTDNAPITEDDLGKIVASVENGVNKKGFITGNGMRALREFLAAREGRAMATKSRKPDEASFTDPNVAVQKNAKEATAKANEPELAEVSEDADDAFFAIVEASGYYKTLRAKSVRNHFSAVLKAASDEGTPMSEDMSAAIRRRIDQLEGDVGATYTSLKSQQEVAKFKSGMSVAARNDDLKYTPKRVAEATRKAGDALAFDQYAGRVFRNYTDVATGETRTSSKLNNLFKPGYETSDGRTITVGADGLQRRNETREVARSTAEDHLNRGKLRGVYPYPARAGQAIQGSRVPAEEGQEVFGVLIHNEKTGSSRFYTYPTEAQALDRMGVKRAEQYKIVDDNIKGISVREEFEKLIDKAEDNFGKDGDLDKFVDEKETLKARARKGGLEVDGPEQQKVVDGQGNDVTDVQELPDVPLTRGDKILMILPKTLELKPRVMAPYQVDNGGSLARLLGKQTVENYNIGYVPREVDGKKITSATDRDKLKSLFEPLDQANDIGEQPAPKKAQEKLPEAPLDYSDAMNTVVDIKRLASTPEGKSIARRLYIGAKLVNSTNYADTLEEFMVSKPSLADMADILKDIENANFRLDIPNSTTEVPFGNRLDAITAYLHVLNKEVPLGLRLPGQDIEKSIVELRKTVGQMNNSTFAHIERMFRAIAPQNSAPAFKPISEYNLSGFVDDDVAGLYASKPLSYQEMRSIGPGSSDGDIGPDFNNIFLNSKKMDKDGTKTGISSSFVVMHELGHWAYMNLMTPEMKLEFWQSASKYYDQKGRFDGGFVSDRVEGTLLDAYSPMVRDGADVAGITNSKQNPGELFANQFALWAHHKFDAPIAPMSFFEKATKLIQKLWKHITNRHIVDPELEPIFEKMIASKDEALRVRYTMPVEAQTKLGQSLRIRYDQVSKAVQDFEAARDGFPEMHDIEKMGLASRRLAATFQGIAMTKRDRAILASREGRATATDRALIEGYTGAFQAIKGHTKLRGFAKQINELTGSVDYAVDTVNDQIPDDGNFWENLAAMGGSSYHPDMAKDMIALWDSGLGKYAKGKLEEINEAYMNVEYGDIPEAKISDELLATRERVGLTPKMMEKIASKKKMKAATNRQRRNFKKSLEAIMSKQGKSNKEEFKGQVVKGTKGGDTSKYSLAEALAEYRRQIDVDGKPTEFGGKLANRVRHLVRTDVQDIVLTEEEQAIYNTWQSKEKVKGGGNKGKANAVQKDELALGLAFSADGETIKGLGATPEQAMNIMKNLIRTRAANRAAKKGSRESNAVEKAIIVEQAQDAGTAFENGIPPNATVKMREYLRGITHRDNQTELVSRTITARLARLGVESLPQSVDAASYGSYRKVVRTVGTNLVRGDDISGAVSFVGEALYSSHAVSHSTRNVFAKASSVLGIPQERLFADVLVEATDLTSNNPQIKAIQNIMDGEDMDFFDDFIEELDDEIMEATGYVLNGLISSLPARERFSMITAYGDMIGSASQRKGSPRARYGDSVPAEYAIDHANEIMEDYSMAGYEAVREFTGDNIVPNFTNGQANGIFGRGTYVTRQPLNTVQNRRDEIIGSASAEKREDVMEIVDALEMTRSKINNARIDGSASGQYIDKLYALDDVLSEELAGMGVNLRTETNPVFIRDLEPALFTNEMTVRSPMVKAIISHLKASGKPREATELSAIRGVYTSENMAAEIIGVIGGLRKFKRVMKDAGFTSIEANGEKIMLSNRDVRSIRSDVFDDATTIIGENSNTHSINGRIMEAATVGSPVRVLNQAATELEQAGVPARTLEAMISVARGRGMPSEAASEIRKSNIFNPIRTNSKIMDRSGLKTLANFFEPKDGSGGHFERTNARMGKFVIPLTKLLKQLPDSSNKLVNYWRTGPQLMAESAMGAMGINPKRRMTQPASHMRIISALRDENKASSLIPQEAEVYNHVRGYLDEATGRLKSSGAIVGEIKRNYFPQVWRKDLIEADPEEFVRRLKKYFLAERNGAGDAAKAETSARRVVQRLLDEDGVYSNPAQNFKRMSNKAGDQSDHLDYNRLIRLDEFPEFADFDTPDSLAVFLENDVLVAMTKYSDNLEHRIDITEEFGVGAHGYHDYLSIVAQPMNAVKVIGGLLSSNKIINANYVRSGGTDHGVKESIFDNNYFYAPIKEKFAAERKAEELIKMAQGGSSAAEIEANIMDVLGEKLSDNPDAVMLRNNFRKRAKAVASALSDTEGLQKVTSNQNLRHAQGFMNSAMRRPVDGVHGTFSMVSASKWLRGVNAVTLLGFTTLTSLGDLVLPLIRTGDIGAYTKSLRKFATDPEYRDMIRNIGAATENAVHQRLTVAHGVDSTQFMTGFFNSTLLTPWTDMMRDVAGAVSYEHLKAQHRILKTRPTSRAGRIARRILREEGLAEFVDDQSLDMDLIMESRFSGNEHPLADKLSSSTIKLTNQMIFTPNPNDIPLWAQTPLGAIAFQLKSYPLMMTRLVNNVAGEAFRGDTVAERGANFAKAFVGGSDNRLGPLAALLVAGPAMGGVAVGAKDIVQGRGGEDNREFELRERKLSETITGAFEDNEDMDMLMGWYFDGMVALGGMGLIGELMYDIGSQTDNGAYGAQRTLETIGGPTVGLFNDAQTVLQGGRSWLDGTDANGMRRAATREVVGRVPVLGGVSWAKEAIVDGIAGERGAGGRKKTSGYGGGFGGGY